MARAPTLASVFESEVRALVAVPARADAVRTVDRWAGEVTARVRAAVAAGSPVDGLAAVDRTLLEATQVLAVLPPAGASASFSGWSHDETPSVMFMTVTIYRYCH